MTKEMTTSDNGNLEEITLSQFIMATKDEIFEATKHKDETGIYLHINEIELNLEFMVSRLASENGNLKVVVPFIQGGGGEHHEQSNMCKQHVKVTMKATDSKGDNIMARYESDEDDEAPAPHEYPLLSDEEMMLLHNKDALATMFETIKLRYAITKEEKTDDEIFSEAMKTINLVCDNISKL